MNTSRETRIDHVEKALHNQRMSGSDASDDVLDDAVDYVEGRIDADELVARTKERIPLSEPLSRAPRAVTVEFRAPNPASRGFRTQAELTVFADNSHSIVGDLPEGVLDIPVPVRDSGGAVRTLGFGVVPATWARKVSRELRTGYLAAVVTYDAETDTQE